MVTNYVPLFGFIKNGWSGMVYNGTHSIKSLNIIFPPIWGVSNGMKLYN